MAKVYSNEVWFFAFYLYQPLQVLVCSLAFFINRYIATLVRQPVSLLDHSYLKQIDAASMHRVYDDWPNLARESYESQMQKLDFDSVDHIIFCGMGGSGALGDIFASILSKKPIHVSIVKGYHLPSTTNNDSLVIATSISGDTTETLSVMKKAREKGTKLVGFSSGGKMEEYCQKNKIRYQNIPMQNSPRASFASFLYGMLNVLDSVIPVPKNDIQESIGYLEETRKKICSENLGDSNISLQLAKWLSDITMIYYPAGLAASAIRFKNSLQENAKSHAMVEDVIEACHNGIVAWERESDVRPVLIRGRDDYFKTKELWGIVKEYFEKNSISYWEVNSVSGSILSKIVNLIYVLDYATIYKAVMFGTDPTPISSIDFVKNNVS